MFAKRLSMLRVEKNLTQVELGKALNLGSSTVGMYETEQRKPDIEKLIAFCSFFNVSSDFILGLSNERTSIHNNYTQEQTELNQLFSKLDPINQGALLERARMLIESQANNPQIKTAKKGA